MKCGSPKSTIYNELIDLQHSKVYRNVQLSELCPAANRSDIYDNKILSEFINSSVFLLTGKQICQQH